LARLRIYTDENVDVRVAQGLLRLGVDAVSVYDSGTAGMSDQAQLAYATSLGAVVFTHDADVIDIAKEINGRGEDHCGVIFLEMHRLRLGECIRRLALYAEVVRAEEMVNRIEFL
jgi:predicted nuclease of predicted toxin-antitoxin system